MQKVIKFKDLYDSDLIIDALYEGGSKGNASDDPLGKILACGNSGGFRPVGTIKNWSHKYIVLYSSLKDLDWPDYIDEQTGQFIYYGDNKSPGRELHDTKKNGNRILRHYFERVHEGDRGNVAPFFVFTKGSKGRDVIFKGLAVPGYASTPPTEDLIAVWKSKGGKRFQNYKAIFTLLDIPVIKREWISGLLSGKTLTSNCPKEWVKWVEKGIYTPLKAEKTLFYRTKLEQLPEDKDGRNIIELIYKKYQDYPYGFEKCATEIVKLMDKNVIECINTRPWLDGRRDALGKYRIGNNDNFIEVEFAIEAKCYDLENSVRIKDTMRLISRLKYRQFGILVIQIEGILHDLAHRFRWKFEKKEMYSGGSAKARAIIKKLGDKPFEDSLISFYSRQKNSDESPRSLILHGRSIDYGNDNRLSTVLFLILVYLIAFSQMRIQGRITI